MLNLVLTLVIFSLSFGFVFSSPFNGDDYCSAQGSLTKSVKNMDKGVGPFTPEELGGCSPLPKDESPHCISCDDRGHATAVRKRALRNIGIHCGRCHRWATDSNLVLREKKHIIPMIKYGHGLRCVTSERKTFLLKAFVKDGCEKSMKSDGKMPVNSDIQL